MQENFNWIENYYLRIKDQEALYGGKANELLNQNKIDNYEILDLTLIPK